MIESSNSEDSHNRYPNIEAPNYIFFRVLEGTDTSIVFCPAFAFVNKDNIRQLMSSVIHWRLHVGNLSSNDRQRNRRWWNDSACLNWMGWRRKFLNRRTIGMPCSRWNKTMYWLEIQPSVHLAFSSDIQIPCPSRGVITFWTQLQIFLPIAFYGTEEHLSRISEYNIASQIWERLERWRSCRFGITWVSSLSRFLNVHWILTFFLCRDLPIHEKSLTMTKMKLPLHRSHCRHIDAYTSVWNNLLTCLILLCTLSLDEPQSPSFWQVPFFFFIEYNWINSSFSFLVARIRRPISKEVDSIILKLLEYAQHLSHSLESIDL